MNLRQEGGFEEDGKEWKRVKESEGEWKRVDESRSDWTCRRRRKGLTNMIIIIRCKMVGILNKQRIQPQRKTI